MVNPPLGMVPRVVCQFLLSGAETWISVRSMISITFTIRTPAVATGNAAMTDCTKSSASTFLRQVPKVELHAHLNGSIPPGVLRALAKERSVTLSDQHAYSTMRSLSDCFELFAELPEVINDLDALSKITQAALEFFANDHVSYLELRSTPKRLWKDYRHQNAEDSMATKQDYVETILNVIKDFNKMEEDRFGRLDEGARNDVHTRLPMVCRFIVSIDRAASIQEAEENLQVAVQFQSTGLIVGLDLGGNPTKQSFSLFEPIFQKARTEYDFKCTIHCAEVESDEYLDIIQFRPDRLGHAVLMPPESFATLRIPVETCPTSNLLTLQLNHHDISTLQSMNVRHWIANDYPFAVCTDDPGIFHTSPTQELNLLKAAFHDLFDVERTMLRSISYGFAEPQLLKTIGSLMERRFSLMCVTDLTVKNP